MEIEIEAIGKQDKWSLNQGRISIGRGAKCDVNLPARHYPSITGEHAVLEVVQGTLRLAGGSGANAATYLNGRAAGAGTIVRSGDTIRLGSDGPELRIRVSSRQDREDAPAHEPTRVLRVEEPMNHEATRVMSVSGSTADAPAPGARRRIPNNHETKVESISGNGGSAPYTPSPRFSSPETSVISAPAGLGRNPEPRNQFAPAPAPAAAQIDDSAHQVLAGQLKFMRNLMFANLAILVALMAYAFQQNRQLVQTQKDLQDLRTQAQSAVGQLTPALDARLGVFEKRMDGVDGRLRTAQDHMEAGMETKMKAVQEQMATSMDANMKTAEDRLVARMNQEIPAMLDKYVAKKLPDLMKH